MGRGFSRLSRTRDDAGGEYLDRQRLSGASLRFGQGGIAGDYNFRDIRRNGRVTY